MRQEVNHSQLYHDLQKTSGYKNNFTYAGAKALMEYLDNFAQECEMTIEYDPIGFCCEYTEYESLQEFNECYDTEYEEIDEISDLTTVIRVDHESFIVRVC